MLAPWRGWPEPFAAVVLGGNAGEILVAQEAMWPDSVRFSTCMTWGYSTPVLTDGELSVNFPMKKSRDVRK